MGEPQFLRKLGWSEPVRAQRSYCSHDNELPDVNSLRMDPPLQGTRRHMLQTANVNDKFRHGIFVFSGMYFAPH